MKLFTEGEIQKGNHCAPVPQMHLSVQVVFVLICMNFASLHILSVCAGINAWLFLDMLSVETSLHVVALSYAIV